MENVTLKSGKETLVRIGLFIGFAFIVSLIVYFEVSK